MCFDTKGHASSSVSICASALLVEVLLVQRSLINSQQRLWLTCFSWQPQYRPLKIAGASSVGLPQKIQSLLETPDSHSDDYVDDCSEMREQCEPWCLGRKESLTLQLRRPRVLVRRRNSEASSSVFTENDQGQLSWLIEEKKFFWFTDFIITRLQFWLHVRHTGLSRSFSRRVSGSRSAKW